MSNKLFEYIGGNRFKLISESEKMNNPCWKGYEPVGTKEKNGRTVSNCVPVDEAEHSIEDNDELLEFLYYLKEQIETEVLTEATYKGKSVKLNTPTSGDVKKFKVFVKDPNSGNVKKVNFGDPNMRIKKNNPARRKSFRARHRCDNPGPKTKARYWSCKKW